MTAMRLCIFHHNILKAGGAYRPGQVISGCVESQVQQGWVSGDGAVREGEADVLSL